MAVLTLKRSILAAFYTSTHSNDTAVVNKITHVQFFPCLTLSWHTLIIFRIYAIENRLDFVFLDDKSLQRRHKFVGERDFP